jgi:plasmid stabilization system protein ParE
VKPARFHPEAQAELEAEAAYYEERSAGLGERFTHDVEAAIALASAFPEIGAPYRYGTRRVFPKRFPFAVVYQVFTQELVILAIAPFPRKPAYWRSRKVSRT